MDAPAESIRALADRVDRDIRRVHDDVQLLSEYRIVHFEEHGGARRPFVPSETVRIEVVLIRPAPSGTRTLPERRSHTVVPESFDLDVDRKRVEVVVRTSDERGTSFVSQRHRVGVRQGDPPVSLHLAGEPPVGPLAVDTEAGQRPDVPVGHSKRRLRGPLVGRSLEASDEILHLAGVRLREEPLDVTRFDRLEQSPDVRVRGPVSSRWRDAALKRSRPTGNVLVERGDQPTQLQE